jgi:uncharacterized protein
MQKTAIWLIEKYQESSFRKKFSPCYFEPTCSNYAILALKKYGFIAGSIKILGRLLKCNPIKGGGVDYP